MNLTGTTIYSNLSTGNLSLIILANISPPIVNTWFYLSWQMESDPLTALFTIAMKSTLPSALNACRFQKLMIIFFNAPTLKLSRPPNGSLSCTISKNFNPGYSGVRPGIQDSCLRSM